MEPRIYVYRITFVDQPYWYWGVHKERKFDEYYMGSPVTNKRYWELYEPIKHIVKVFDRSDDNWIEALSIERDLIAKDLNNPLCLNSGCWGLYSIDSLKKRWDDPSYREAHRRRVSGPNNSQFGTRFIHNPSTFKNTRLKKTEPLPDGWVEGAKFSSLSEEDRKTLIKASNIVRRMKLGHKPCTVEEADEIIKSHLLQKEKGKESFLEEIRYYYSVYIDNGFQAVVDLGYNKSQSTLVNHFKKYVPEFAPQAGKKRG